MNKSVYVIKCGGSTLATLPDHFYADIKQLYHQGHYPVIVHGGGPAISHTLEQLGIPSTFIHGLRVTDEATLDVVEMILGGKINKEVVRKVQSFGLPSLGLTGIDGRLLIAIPVHHHHEVGYVGEVQEVNTDLLHRIIEIGVIPVIAPIGISADQQQRYNINADTAAGAIASALKVQHFVMVTDVPGIIKGKDQDKQVVPEITVKEIQDMIDRGEIYGGMIPKVQAAIEGLKGSVQEVVIVDGHSPAILSQVLQSKPVGTRIRKS